MKNYLREERGPEGDDLKPLSATTEYLKDFISDDEPATVFLNSRLAITTYNEGAAALLNLPSNATGLRLADIDVLLTDVDLAADLGLALAKGRPHQRIITTAGHKRLIRKILKFQESVGEEVLVLTFTDVTELEKSTLRTKRRVEQQAAIADMGLMALTENLSDLYGHIVRKMVEVLDVPYCKILRYRPASNDLIVEAGLGWDAELLGDGIVAADLRTQAGYTLMANAPVIVEDLRTETRFSGPNLLTAHGVISGISCPISRGNSNEPYGIIGVHTRAYKYFSADDAHFIRSIAYLLSAAIGRKEAEEELIEERQRLNLARDAAHIGIHDHDMVNDTILWDEKVCAIWGVPCDGKPIDVKIFLESLHPEDFERATKEIYAAADPNGPGEVKVEYRIYNRETGNLVWVEATAKTTFKNGKAVRMVGTVQDITERKNILELLHTSETQFRTMANSIPQLAWMTDSRGYITWYNRRWYDYTGSNLERMKGWGWTEVHHPDHVERVISGYKRSVSEGRDWEDTFPLRSESGEYRWFLSRAEPIKNEDGAIMHWFGTNTDITEKLKQEEALRESQEKLRLAMETNRIGSFEYYFNFEQTEWDGLLKELWGLGSDEVPTQRLFRKGIHPDDLAMLDAEIAKSCKLGEGGYFHAVYRVVNIKSGAISWIESSGRTLFEDGKPHRMIGMIIDITEQKELQESLQNVVRELEAANIRKNEFLATLGHELRNPLAAINSGIQILNLDINEAEWAVGMMANNVKLIGSLLDDLLDLTRISKGKIKLKKESLDLSAIIEEVVRSFVPVMVEKEQILTASIPEVPVYVNADRTRLEQILSNLLYNAHKFTQNGGLIEVFLEKNDGVARVRVVDNGLGIAPDKLEKIFDPFEQITDDASPNTGLGIGLSLVNQFMRLHGGRAIAESEGKGKGCTFTIVLPAIEGIVLPTVPEPLIKTSIKHGLRIMIIDDNIDAVKGLKALLEDQGCQVESAYNGKMALEKMLGFRPQVVMIDIGLPDITGYELHHKLRERSKTKLVSIAITGFGHKEARLKSTEAGFDYHFNKPANFNQLLDVLAKVS